MGNREMTTVERLRLEHKTAMQLFCPFCGAPPGYGCRTRDTGNPIDKLHEARYKKAREELTN